MAREHDATMVARGKGGLEVKGKGVMKTFCLKKNTCA